VSSYVQVRAALLNKVSYICSIASVTIVDNAFASALPRSFRRYSFPVQMRTHTLCVCSLHGVNPLVITRSLGLRTAPLLLHQAATINLNVSPMSGSSLSHVSVEETGESLLRRLAASIGQRISRSVHGEVVSGSARTDFAKPTVIIQRLHRKATNILNIASVVYQNTISLATPNPRQSLRYWL